MYNLSSISILGSFYHSKTCIIIDQANFNLNPVKILCSTLKPLKMQLKQLSLCNIQAYNLKRLLVKELHSKEMPKLQINKLFLHSKTNFQTFRI